MQPADSDEDKDIEGLIRKDLSDLSRGAGLKDRRFGDTRLVKADKLPGSTRQQASLYEKLILRNIENVEPERSREALCVKLNLDGYPNSSSKARLGLLGRNSGRVTSTSPDDKGRNKRSEDIARHGRNLLATLISKEIAWRDEHRAWGELLGETFTDATADEWLFVSSEEERPIRASAGAQSKLAHTPPGAAAQKPGPHPPKLATQATMTGWSQIEIQWMMDHVARQYGWELTPDDQRACLIAVRTSAQPPADGSNRLKVLADFLKGFLRERLVAREHEMQREMRRIATKIAMAGMQNQAVPPLSDKEKMFCYGMLRAQPLSELRRIADKPRKLRMLQKRAIEAGAEYERHVDEMIERAVKEFGAGIGSHQAAMGRIIKALGRNLTKREINICFSIPSRVRNRKLTEDELLERFGKALKLDDTAMAIARAYQFDREELMKINPMFAFGPPRKPD